MFILLILNKLIPNYTSQITKKASSFEEAFVPGAGVEPARFPTGV